MASKIKKILSFRNLLFVFFLSVFVLSAYHIADYMLQAGEAENVNRDLIEEAVGKNETFEKQEVLKTDEGEETVIQIMKTPDISVDLGKATQTYPNVVGWLYGPNGVLNNPVLQTDDNDYYLNHLPDGRLNQNGSIFMDFRDLPDLSAWKSVIYGYHMQNGSMFAPLLNYRDQAYFENNPYLFYFTESATYRLEIFSAFDTTVKFSIFEDYWGGERESVRKNQLEDLISSSLIRSEVDVSTQDRIMILMTCSSAVNQDENRFLVAAKLIQIN